MRTAGVALIINKKNKGGKRQHILQEGEKRAKVESLLCNCYTLIMDESIIVTGCGVPHT
jgi:hypothetical protein